MSDVPDSAAVIRRRRLIAASIGVMLVLSLLLPHVSIRGADSPERWLLPAGHYFLNVDALSLGRAPSLPLGIGLNVAYLGIALHQLGLLLGLVTFWAVAGDDLNRWLWWMMAIGGGLLTAGALVSLLGWYLMVAADLPAVPGYAWLPTLVAGAALLVEARLSKDRIDYTWFPAKPELQ